MVAIELTEVHKEQPRHVPPHSYTILGSDVLCRNRDRPLGANDALNSAVGRTRILRDTVER